MRNIDVRICALTTVISLADRVMGEVDAKLSEWDHTLYPCRECGGFGSDAGMLRDAVADYLRLRDTLGPMTDVTEELRIEITRLRLENMRLKRAVRASGRATLDDEPNAESSPGRLPLRPR